MEESSSTRVLFERILATQEQIIASQERLFSWQERLVASHEQLATDMAQIQQTMDTVLLTLRQSPPTIASRDSVSALEQRPPSVQQRFSHHQSPAAQSLSASKRFGAVPPSLASIVSPPIQHSEQMLSDQPPASESPKPQLRYAGERVRASSGSDSAINIADSSGSAGHVGLPPLQRHHVHEYSPADARSPTSRLARASPPMPSQTAGASAVLPPPSCMQLSTVPALAASGIPSRNPPVQGFPRIQSPTPTGFNPRFHQLQSPSPTAPLSAPSSSSSAFPSARLSSAHRGEYRHPRQPLAQQQSHSVSLPRLTHHSHLHYSMQGAPGGPHRTQAPPTHSEQTVLLQPLTRTPPAPRLHGNSQHFRSTGQQREPMVTSPYPSGPASASGMVVDIPSAKHSPPPYGQSRPGYVPPHTADSTTSEGMAVSPTDMASGAQASVYSATAPSGNRPYSSSAQDASTQQKMEKNRFQANIRAYVDQHFMVPTNLRWDYQQSFKAPHNAETTQQIADAFRLQHGSTFERIQHGLGVYFSSLKAKHRSSEEKTMVKQQRDRRRARRIKKANGRRKVFDQSQYPFLTDDFDPKRCFIPVATSPEHTDDDGEVKVGVLPWRLDTYSNLFHHLDTMRTKRTIRPLNPQLTGGSVPPPEVPDFMINPRYLSMDRSHRGHDPENDPEEPPQDPEEDIEMGSSSD
ncbi:hypothetical protein IWW36_003427 [Coemansia brasiliensis]|uniref:Uncharacterized protein n=1 Tax=Coemansia brasiliensis TaxID=2650707 RepID=A0A9W8IA73_9FUNG|nr:hypothetical protein IWW36_003427 [Coemansia brasiliensis]